MALINFTLTEFSIGLIFMHKATACMQHWSSKLIFVAVMKLLLREIIRVFVSTRNANINVTTAKIFVAILVLTY